MSSRMGQAILFARRRRGGLQETGLLLATFGVVAAAFYQFDIFPSDPGASPQGKIIELDEALAIASLFCVCMLTLSWRFLLTQRKEVARRVDAERQARELALQDALTGLPNRRRFDQELKAALGAPPRAGGAHAVLLLDLNHFKRVNDMYGHGAGDAVLIMAARRLQRAVRDGDLVVRFGGDEFAILARQLAGAEDATSIALRVIAEFDQPIIIDSTQHAVGVGIGIALFPNDAQSADDLLRKADIALYRAKADAGSASRFFEPEMDARIRERDLLERDLRIAVRDGDVVPFFQPLINLKTRQVVGFEALARWTHPTLGEIPPDRFIPVAESCGLIGVLSEQLLAKAAATACQWPSDITLSFNISPLQLKDQTLGLRILKLIGDAGLPAHRLELELTESALVRDLEGAQEVLGGLRAAGVRIALDDFGTGYSSLYHLRNFKVDKIKIDRSFVNGVGTEVEADALVQALLGLGQGLGLTVTAEGVEECGQATALLERGCDQGQGFLFARAMTAAQTAQFIESENAKLHVA
jgi:diguanylate cyclase (GGDEF)-like protein